MCYFPSAGFLRIVVTSMTDVSLLPWKRIMLHHILFKELSYYYPQYPMIGRTVPGNYEHKKVMITEFEKFVYLRK